jgi:hypothetical protein
VGGADCLEVEIGIAHTPEAPLDVYAAARLETHGDDVTRGQLGPAAQRDAERAVVRMRPQLEATPGGADHRSRSRAPARPGRHHGLASGSLAPPAHAGSVDAATGAA